MTRRTGPSQAVRDDVYARDGLACVICRATSPLNLHHRRGRGSGGTRRPETNLPANLVVLCGSGTQGCHGWVTQNPAEARQSGYTVRQHVDPESVPLVWCGVWVWLGNDGTVHQLGAADIPGGAA